MKFKVRSKNPAYSDQPIYFKVYDTVWVPEHRASWAYDRLEEGGLHFIGQYEWTKDPAYVDPNMQGMCSVRIGQFEEIPDES